jgi:hypothetical protein
MTRPPVSPRKQNAASARSQRGGIISGLLTIFGIIVLIAFASGLYLARNVRVQTTHRDRGDDVAISVPGGSLSIQAHHSMDPAAIGVPVYPGATRRKDSSGGANFRWETSDGKGDKNLGIAAGEFLTQDSADRVLSWYRSQLPHWVAVEEDDHITHFELRDGGFKRIVSIKQKSDGTHISVVSIGEPASN